MQFRTEPRLRSLSPLKGSSSLTVLAAGFALFAALAAAGAGRLALAQGSPRDSLEPPEGWELSGDAERVRATYDQLCATCHGPEGKGDGVMSKFIEPKPKDLTDREYMETRSDYELYVAIKKGGAAVGLSDKMAPWEPLLEEQQIRDLTLLVRELSHGP